MTDSRNTIHDRPGDRRVGPQELLAGPLSLLPAVVARLGQLRSGDVATVTGLDSTRLAAKRLADMGFIPGVKVEMLRSGTPCLVRVNGICLGLGAGHQESILLSALASG